MRTWRKKRKRDISGALMLIGFGLVVMLGSIALSSSRLLMFDYGILGFFTGFTLFLVSVISLA
ncbi:MAG: hypothetical protein KKA79_08570 [Nanoarchaeota archaeon]|nr:hypothetical protein [Nanoarchaeota archaeon]MCG2717946.1 hypothetical protein [Nanoarchaeota archaeon]